MQLFILQQNDFYDFTTPDKVNTMIVRAENIEHARTLAQNNEEECRDGEQRWDSKHASVGHLPQDGVPGVILAG